MDSLLAGCQVLVVEDEMLVVMLIEDMLGDLGCTSVVAAGTVERALAAIDAHAFDLAMLDENLSGSSSAPVAEALLARGVPFFWATGQTGPNAARAAWTLPVLKKPFHFRDLEACVRLALAPRQL